MVTHGNCQEHWNRLDYYFWRSPTLVLVLLVERVVLLVVLAIRLLVVVIAPWKQKRSFIHWLLGIHSTEIHSFIAHAMDAPSSSSQLSSSSRENKY